MPRRIVVILVRVEQREELAAASARVLASKRVAAAEEDKQRHPASPDVLGAGVVVGAAHVGPGGVDVDVGSAVLGGAELGDEDRLETLLLISLPSKPKVANLEGEPLVEHDVVGLDVAVRCAHVVDVINAIHQLHEVVPGKAHLEGPPTFEEGKEVCAGTVLQNNEGQMLAILADAGGRGTFLVVDPVYLHNVWVDELGEGQKPLELLGPVGGPILRVRGVLRRLDRHRCVAIVLVPCLPHETDGRHLTRVDELGDLEAGPAQRRPNKRAILLVVNPVDIVSAESLRVNLRRLSGRIGPKVITSRGHRLHLEAKHSGEGKGNGD
mmetsp:Transcript_7754/g.18882  ORF Transcript_7754/g.18882 Transcript_7754/m.18882 type:complete len:324 (+) Transcript_7754:634-1605(+)